MCSGRKPSHHQSTRKPAHQSRPPPHTGIGMAARKPVLRRLRGVWRYRCRQVVTAERHLYGDRDPVLETSKLPNSAGDRWFESISLQQRVSSEPCSGCAARWSAPSSDHGRGNRIQESDQARFCGPPSRLAHNRDGTKDARQGYLSSQTSSMRQLLIMLLTIIVHPFTCGCQQYAKRL